MLLSLWFIGCLLQVILSWNPYDPNLNAADDHIVGMVEMVIYKIDDTLRSVYEYNKRGELNIWKEQSLKIRNKNKWISDFECRYYHRKNRFKEKIFYNRRLDSKLTAILNSKDSIQLIKNKNNIDKHKEKQYIFYTELADTLVKSIYKKSKCSVIQKVVFSGNEKKIIYQNYLENQYEIYTERFDSLGRKIWSEYSRFTFNGNALISKYSDWFNYDELGRMSRVDEFAYYESDTTHQSMVLQYDDHNSIIYMSVETKNYKTILEYHYTYDAIGNWLNVEVLMNGELYTVMCRDFKYY